MKKGFTLIELLAVIIVLGFLTAIISPVVTNLINSSKDNLREEQRNLIVEATKKYMIENSDLLPDEGDDSRVFVYTDELVSSGVIDNDKIIDPKTKEDIKGCVVIRYNDEFNQYEYNYEDDYDNCLINVTFDPEDGSVDITSKKVRYNSTYGDLPTPTREGYTFKGWRGKNMFDEETILMAIDGAKYENGYYVFSHVKAQRLYAANDSKVPIEFFKDNTRYTYTIDGYVSDNRMTFYFKYMDDTTSYGNFDSKEEYEKIVKSNANKTIKELYIGYGSVTGDEGNERLAYISHIQLEEGDTATEYEPYQEYSSDTVVTKDSDHTLYAIWEPNSYTVTFDPEGGSVDTVSKQVRYNSTYGDLPTPTREGYTFKGWRGKNMFDEETILMSLEETIKDGGFYKYKLSNAHRKYNLDGKYAYNDFVQNQQYTLSLKAYVPNENTIFSYYFYYDDGTNKYLKNWDSSTVAKEYTVTTASGKNIDRFSLSYNGGAYAYVSEIQLEKGDTATEYEPYQEYSSDTVVTKPSDHVLHAIWEVAS